ncbi:hypothetical protein [Paludibacterium denitrificans]|nr:hypothetical protein [Paludibacterium denitrificans]
MAISGLHQSSARFVESVHCRVSSLWFGVLMADMEETLRGFNQVETNQ